MKITENNKVIIIITFIVGIIIIIIALIIIFSRKVPANNCLKLDPPQNFNVSTGADTPYKAILTWDSIPGATTYVVYRKSSPNISKVSYTERIFTTKTNVVFDHIIFPDQYFRISVFNDCGEGELSSEKYAVVECRFDPPTGLDVHMVNVNLAEASWNQVSNSIGYHLYVNNVKLYSGILASYQFPTPTPGIYKVQVSTQNNCGEGPKSSSVNYDVPNFII